MTEIENNDTSLLSVLNRLVTALEPRCFGDPVLDVRSDAVPEHWEDTDYAYIETNVPGAGGVEMGISIHSGLVLIRIAR